VTDTDVRRDVAVEIEKQEQDGKRYKGQPVPLSDHETTDEPDRIEDQGIDEDEPADTHQGK
jgi:hypothetical protein